MEFRILGPLEVHANGRELPLGGAKQRALLALLVLRANELVPTERIVEELWGERPPATARGTVQVYISQLRKVLGRELVETRGPGYLLKLPREALDMYLFEDKLGEGRRLLGEGAAAGARALLDEALSLWRGPALSEFQYEPFAQNEIARLEELRLAAQELLLEARVALGLHVEAVPDLEALVRAHPLREHLRRLLMLALYRGGRQADALSAYQEARVALVDELGLEPSHALQQLERAILKQDDALDLPVLFAQPPAPAPARAEPAAAACPECGAANDPSARFCHACGRVLAFDLPTEARKTVTVIFCDVVASTELAERLDPESQRTLLARFFDLASTVLARYGGTVEKFVGDAVMAVFGVPIVREDDALRAVRAAAEIRELVRTRLPDLQLKMGVNSGEVVAGDPSTGATFVTGDAVNTGKRLEELAGPGEILLGAETRALVAHAITGEELESVEIKGKHSLLAAFRLESVDPDAPAFRRPAEAPLVDRTAELSRLREVYDAVAAGGGARLVTIVGDAGIGKSRLVRELLGGVGDAATVMIGRCPPYGEGVTLLPLRDILRRAGREESELGSSSHAIFAAVRKIVEELAEERPLIAAFDDVHWAEPTFLDLVEYLQGRLGAARVLIVCLSRPELADLRPGWLQEPAVAIAVAPLSAAESELLLDGLAAPAGARQRIADAAEGNPLFVEQLALLAEEQWTLPASIRGVLAERLDRLPREERAVLERGAVAGRSFSVESVIDLCPPELREQVHPRLLALVRARLLRADTELPDGFRFQHALIRDAAYDRIPKAARADLHRRMAGLVDDDALGGYHLEQAAQYREQLGARDDELAARAAALLHLAGRAAFARSDLPAAISFFDRARALVENAESALLTELGSALTKLGDYARAQTVLVEAIEAAGTDRRAELRARVELQFARSFFAPDPAENIRVALALMPELEQLGDELGLAKAWWLKSEGEVFACRWRERAEALEHALTHARRGDAGADELSMISGLLSQALLFGPANVTDAIARCTELLDEAGADRARRATISMSLGGLMAMQGRFDEARRTVRDANAVYEEFDLRVRSAMFSGLTAQIEVLAGDPVAAGDVLRGAIAVLEESGARAVAATLRGELAHVLLLLGRFEEAEALSREVQRAAEHDDLAPQVRWRTTLGRILVARQELDEADVLLREAVELTDEVEFPDYRVAALVAAAEGFEARGKAEQARRLLTDARGLMAEKGNVVAVAQFDAALAGSPA